MISTRRGLAVLLAIVTLLTVLLVRELHRSLPAPEDRAIVPGLDPDRITEMTWERSPLAAVTVGGSGTSWSWTSTTFVARADARVVHDVLAALRAGRWHRHAEVAAAGAVRVQLSLTIGTVKRVIGIAAPLAGTEQTWLVVGDRALLVDTWVARALAPEPLALRVRRPVDDAVHASAITLGIGGETSRLEGVPRQLISPRRLLVRTALIAQLEAALEAVELVRLSRPPADDGEYLDVTLGPVLRLGPICPDDRALAWLSSDAGDGCITRAAYDAVKAAIVALAGPPEAVAEPRILPAELDKIVLVEAATLELARRPTLGGKPADPTAVAELLAALAAPAELVTVAETVPVRGRMQLWVRGGSTITLELLGGNLVRREREPIALRPSAGAYAALTRPAKDLLDRSVWSEEPTTISSIRIDAITYTRGAVLGEWTRVPAAAFEPARVEALAAALAAPRRSPDVAAVSRSHQVTVTVTAPAGPPVQHELTVGAPRQGGCVALAAAATVMLPAAVCASLDALGH